jgi:hypothetical protein
MTTDSLKAALEAVEEFAQEPHVVFYLTRTALEGDWRTALAEAFVKFAALRASTDAAPVAGEDAYPARWSGHLTVGNMIANLRTLPLDMPIYSAYHVVLGDGGPSLLRVKTPTMSRERVDGITIKTGDESVPYSAVIWSHPQQPDPAALAHPPVPDAAGEDTGNLRAIVGLFVAKAMVAKWSGGQNSRVRHVPESEIERLGAALSAQAPVEPVVKPRPYPFAVDGMKCSETLIVEGASLTIHTSGYTDEEGRGYFCFDEDECETEYGENGKSYWISHTTNSELIALRDKLNEVFPAALAQPPAAEPVADRVIADVQKFINNQGGFAAYAEQVANGTTGWSRLRSTIWLSVNAALATGNGGEGRS